MASAKPQCQRGRITFKEEQFPSQKIATILMMLGITKSVRGIIKLLVQHSNTILKGAASRQGVNIFIQQPREHRASSHPTTISTYEEIVLI